MAYPIQKQKEMVADILAGNKDTLDVVVFKAAAGEPSSVRILDQVYAALPVHVPNQSTEAKVKAITKEVVRKKK